METVLIADDEKNIREGIKCIIDWEELGFKVCGEAANGEEALKQIYERGKAGTPPPERRGGCRGAGRER